MSVSRLLVSVLALAPGLLLAAEGAAGPDPLSGGYLVKLTVSLLGVLALLFVLVALLKRFGGLPHVARQQAMAVQGTLAVGPRERVVWIEVAGHQLVLGVTSGQIEPLLHLPPEAVVDETAPPDPLMDEVLPAHRPKGDFDRELADVNLRSERR
ncbi:MAG: flagellar biosynthetic protein FliO [Pseudomonadota bacterium]